MFIVDDGVTGCKGLDTDTVAATLPGPLPLRPLTPLFFVSSSIDSFAGSSNDTGVDDRVTGCKGLDVDAGSGNAVDGVAGCMGLDAGSSSTSSVGIFDTLVRKFFFRVLPIKTTYSPGWLYS